MMVPAWTLLALTVVFFLREVYIRTRPTDYRSGYKQAVKDIAREWNKIYATVGVYAFVEKMKNFLQKKLDGS